MTTQEAIATITELHRRRFNALEALYAPARAAANAMKDAKLDHSADPLLEALFKLEAINSELDALTVENGKAVLDAVLHMLSGGKS